MIADKMVNKLNAREEEITEKYFDDEISGTKYVFSGCIVQGIMEGFLDGCVIVGGTIMVATLGTALYDSFKKGGK